MTSRRSRGAWPGWRGWEQARRENVRAQCRGDGRRRAVMTSRRRAQPRGVVGRWSRPDPPGSEAAKPVPALTRV